jgi:general secretion pathway protein B
MSYILDALRKADAERERDPARGIHAQPAAVPPLATAPRVPRWIWPAACGLAVLASAYAFWARAPQVAATAPRPLAAAVPVGLTTAPLAKPTAQVVAVATTVMPPPPAAVEHMAAKAVLAPRVPAAPAAAAAAVSAPAPATGAVPTAPPTTMPVPAVPATPTPAGNERIFALTELPPDVQQALPKLAISGGVYSDNAAQRMVIVGGQVMTEGQELAPGVQLEQIRPRSSVLRFRGYRYSVAY